MEIEIELPHLLSYRPYQKEVRVAFLDGFKRIILVRHRRAGKDKASFNLCVEQALKRVGNYYYCFPEYAQGRKALWDAIDKDGIRVINHVHPMLLKKKNDTEMKIELVNGSTIQIIGSDKIDAIMGTNPVGLVLSEYSLQDPRVWDYLRPILLENGGWALFNYTPRGKNHGRHLYQQATNNPDWFISVKRATETFDGEGNRILNDAELEGEKREMEPELYEQEYMCSFSGGIKGAYFTQYLAQLEAEHRLCVVPLEPLLPVYTARDLGMGDSTAIICFQLVGKEVRIINYHENSNQGLDYYVKRLRDLKDVNGYKFIKHFLPHDVRVREMTTGLSRLQVMERLGVTNIETLPPLSTNDQERFEAIRYLFKYFRIDASLVRLVDCIRDHHKEYDERNKYYKDNPKHDWTSHGVDALAYMCYAVQKLWETSDQSQPAVFQPSFLT